MVVEAKRKNISRHSWDKRSRVLQPQGNWKCEGKLSDRESESSIWLEMKGIRDGDSVVKGLT